MNIPYVIIVYDVSVERVNKVKKYLRRYLFWIQNSVFEGELTEYELNRIEYDLSKIINPSEDSVVIFVLKHKYLVNKKILGKNKALDEDII